MILRRLKKAFRRPVRDTLIDGIAASKLINRWTRKCIYKWYGMSVGNVWIADGCSFSTTRIAIGDGTWINQNCVFDNEEWITIGENCDIAFNVIFVTSSHKIGDRKRRAGAGIVKPINVGSGCWIGAGAVILPGVTIGDGCIIGAGAVVTKDCEPDTLYGGNPARAIRKLEE